MADGLGWVVDGHQTMVLAAVVGTRTTRAEEQSEDP